MNPIRVTCPGCAAPLLLPPGLVGSRVKCKVCGFRFQAGGTEAEAPPRAQRAVGPPPLPPRPSASAVRPLIACTVSLAVILASAAGIYKIRFAGGFAATPPPPTSRGQHACIALETSGIRLLVVSLDAYDDGSYKFRSEDRKSANLPGWYAPDPADKDGLNPGKLDAAAAKVAEFQDVARGMGVPAENVLVACNSGVLRDFAKAGNSETARRQIDAAVAKKCKLTVEHINPDEETRFGALGTLKKRERTKGIFLDLGRSSGKFGAFDEEMFFHSDAGIGFQEFFAKAEKKAEAAGVANPADPNAEFRASLQTVRSDILPKLHEKVRGIGIFKDRPQCDLAGGAFWVVATALHPSEAANKDNLRIKLTLEDIRWFNKQVGMPGSDINALKRFAEGNIRPGSDAEKARAEIEEIMGFNANPKGSEEPTRRMRTFIAAGEIVLVYAEALDLERKETNFFTKSLYVWPLGFILHKNRQER